MPSSVKEAAAAQKNFDLGEQLKDQGNLDLAIEKYNLAVRLTPDNVQALNQLAAAYEAQEKWDEAVNCYQRIIGLIPANPKTYLQLGRALRQQNKLYGAVAAFQQAVELKQDVGAGVYKELGDVLDRLPVVLPGTSDPRTAENARP